MNNDDLYADSAQARTGDVLRQPVKFSDTFDWQAAADRRERDAVAMKARVIRACDNLAERLRM